jgi:alcohol dehydrogenase (cytochrome c)
MRNKNILLLGAAATIVAAALGTVAFGQSAAPLTQAQVDSGRQGFNDNCAQCHNADMSGATDAPALAGSAFMGAWGKRSTQDLYNKISKTMPAGRGGSLDDVTYTNIVAYVLHANGAVAGQTAFTPTTSVAIGSIASGKIPGDVLHPVATPAMAAAGGPARDPNTANSAGFARKGQAVRYGDPGRFTLPSKFGVTLKGDIQNYVPVTDAMLRAGATARSSRLTPPMCRRCS